MRFVIDCIPPKTTAQAGLRIMKRRDGRFFIGKQTGSKAVRVKNWLFNRLEPFKPDKAFEGALKVYIGWYYPYKKSEKKSNIGKMIYCDKRPDADNLLKTLFDVMTKIGFWKDDAQIADLRFIKAWDARARIEVGIEKIVDNGFC